VSRRRQSPARGSGPAVPAPAPRPRPALLATIALVLAALTVIAYLPIGGHDFIDLDDPGYVADNPHVGAGLTPASIAWAFTTGHAANWHPLTWLSHMVDVEIFGVDAGAHHVMSLVLHVVNTLLLFVVLLQLTTGGGLRSVGASAFVAAIFGVHPLHVESVAWVAERKDVLSTLFWLLTTSAYVSYVRSRTAGRAAAVLIFFALGLLSKPMLVTLPFVLMLLHVWPLGSERLGTLVDALRRRRIPRLLLPMLAMAAISSVITFVVQRQGGAVSTLDVMPLGVRLGNALVSYGLYLGKIVWPAHLAVFYPYRLQIPAWQIAGAAVLLVGLSVAVLRLGRRHPAAIVGWLWFLGTLVPVIGIVQVGTQAMADRYTYVPLIGLTIAIAWTAVGVWPRQARLLAATGAVIVIALAIGTRMQVRHWQDSLSLWQHTVDVTRDNYRARNSLGAVLGNQGRTSEAIVHFIEALRLSPDRGEAFHLHHNLGRALAETGKIEDAMEHFREALRLKPDYPEAHNNLGLALARQGRFEAAIEQYHLALDDRPGYPVAIANLADAHNDLGFRFFGTGRTTDAIREYTAALKVRPAFPGALDNRGFAHAVTGNLPAAIADFRLAIEQDPKFAVAYHHLGIALASTGQFDEAEKQLATAVELDPRNDGARQALEKIRGRAKRGGE
jgi:protein O-mannosyl-transferase